MNKTYKTVFNETTGQYQAVSELAKHKGKAKNNVLVAIVLMMSVCSAAATAQENVDCSTAFSGGTAKGYCSTAFGEGKAIGRYSTAMILGDANGDYSFATGGGTADGVYSTAFSSGKAKGDFSTAMTFGRAEGVSSVAMSGGIADGMRSTAMSYGRASGEYSTAMSEGKAIGNHSTAMSYGTAIGNLSTAMSEGTAIGIGSFAVGKDSNAKGDYSIAIGRSAEAEQEDSMAVGQYTTAKGEKSTALGYSSKANGNQSLALGRYATANGNQSLALGPSATANGDNNVALGPNSMASGQTLSEKAYFTGDTAQSEMNVSKDNSRRITGVAAGAKDNDAVNVAQLKKAVESVSGSTNLLAVSYDSESKDKISLSGDGTLLTNLKGGEIAEGSTDAVTGGQLFDVKNHLENNVSTVANQLSEGIRFGDGKTDNQYALGKTISVLGDDNITSKTVPGGVQLGLANVIKIGSHDIPLSIDGDSGVITGLTNTTWPSTGEVVADRAATEGQLQAVYELAATAGGKVKVEGGKNILVSSHQNDENTTVYQVATTADLTANSITFNGTGDSTTTIKLGDNGLDVGGTTITNLKGGEIAKGSTDAVTGGQVFDIKTELSGEIAQVGDKVTQVAGNVTQLTNRITVNEADIVNLKAADALSVKYDGESKDKISLSGAEGTLLTNLKGGEIAKGSTDAVTGGQVFDVKNHLENHVSTVANQLSEGIRFGDGKTDNQYALGKTISVLGDDNITSKTVPGGVQLGLANVIKIGSHDIPLSIDGESGVITGLTNTTWPSTGEVVADRAATEGQLQAVYELAATAGGKVKVEGGKNILVSSHQNDENTTVYQVATTADLTANSITFNGTGESTTTIKLGDNGLDVGGTTITNLKGGEIAKGSTDAVTGGQMFDMQERFKQNLLDVSGISQGLDFAADSGKFNRKLGETIRVVGSNNITTQANNGTITVSMADNPVFKGQVQAQGGLVVQDHLAVAPGSIIDAGGNPISNIGPGTKPGDAVNVQQLAEVQQQLGGQIGQIHSELDRATKDARGGTAAAMAMANLPQAWRPGQSGVAMSGSTYKGQKGYAIGVSHMSENGKWVFKGSVGGSNRGSTGVAVGAFYSFN